jgi:hypothetical protein
MAGKQSAFITGANARVKVGGKTLAYCTDVSYNIAVQTIPIETMGTYEVRDNTPVAYTVDGAFSIIRYTKEAANLDNTNPAIPNPNTDGNRPAAVNTEEGTMNHHLNPALILSSGTFDVEIQEALPDAGGTSAASTKNVFKISDCRLTRRGMTLNKRGVYVDQYAFVGILAGDNEDGHDVASSAFTDLS